MKKTLILAAALVFVVIQVAPAELAPGKTINDYLPVFTGNVFNVNGQVFQLCGNLDEFEIEGSKYKLKDCLEQITEYGAIKINELEFDPDPSVFVNALITNNTASTQTYTFSMSQPAFLAAAPNLVYGSVVVSLLDQSIPANGALLQDSGTSIYKAYIDGVLVDTLLDNPYSLSTTPSGTVSSGLQEFGWQSNGTPVLNDIGIVIQLQLSPGDSATVLSRFDVIVPEPMTLALLGLGASFVLRRRHRV